MSFFNDFNLNPTILIMMAPKHLYFCYESDDRMELKHGCGSDSLPKMLISAFFSGAVLEHLTDHKDSNMLLNFWINGQAFIVSFCFSKVQ